MSEKNDVKANDLKVDVVDVLENHINLIGTNVEIKKTNMVRYICFYLILLELTFLFVSIFSF